MANITLNELLIIIFR